MDWVAEQTSQQLMHAATGGRACYGDLVGRRRLGEAASSWGSAAGPTVVAGDRRGRGARRRGRQQQPQQATAAGAVVSEAERYHKLGPTAAPERHFTTPERYHKLGPTAVTKVGQRQNTSPYAGTNKFEALAQDDSEEAASKESSKSDEVVKAELHDMAASEVGAMGLLCKVCLRRLLLEQRAEACGMVLECEEHLKDRMSRSDRAGCRRTLSRSQAHVDKVDIELGDLQGLIIGEGCECKL